MLATVSNVVKDASRILKHASNGFTHVETCQQCVKWCKHFKTW